MTPGGHKHRGGLCTALARRKRRFGSLLLLLLVVVLMVVLVVMVIWVVEVVVERVRLEGSGLLPLGAVIVRGVTGQIVALRVLLTRWKLGVHIVRVDQIGAHGH